MPWREFAAAAVPRQRVSVRIEEADFADRGILDQVNALERISS